MYETLAIIFLLIATNWIVSIDSHCAYVRVQLCFCTLNFDSMKMKLTYFSKHLEKTEFDHFFHPPAATFPYKKHGREKHSKSKVGEMLGGGNLRGKDVRERR